MVVFCSGGFEDRVPGVLDSRSQCRRPVGGSDVLADRVPLVTIHAALALLEIYRIGGKVPMDHRMTPPMEVDSLLADGGGRENERPEWRVESRPDLGESGLILAAACAAEPQCVPARESDSLTVEVVDVGSPVNLLPEGYRPPCGRGKRDEALVGRRVGPGLRGEMVDVLVEDGLKPPVDAIPSHHPPVRPFVPACARTRGDRPCTRPLSR